MDQSMPDSAIFHYLLVVVVVPSLSHVQLFATPWTAALQASLSFTISGSWLRFMSHEWVMLYTHLILFSFLFLCLQSSPESGYFLMSWLFVSGGQSIGASASASVLPMNIHSWFPLGIAALISLQSRNSQVSSPAPQFKIITSSLLRLLYGPTLTSVHY